MEKRKKRVNNQIRRRGDRLDGVEKTTGVYEEKDFIEVPRF